MAKKKPNDEELAKEAELLYENENFNGVIELLSDNVLEKFHSATLWAWRARAHGRLSDREKEFQFAEKAIEIDANYFMGYLARGNAQTEHEKAIADYDKATELKPHYADTYFNRGNAYFNKGDYDKAIADYNNAIEFKPDFAKAYINRGLAYHEKREYDKEITDYDKATELKPDYADAYFNRGNFHFDKGDYDKAITDYIKAIELNPYDANAYNNRGNTYRNKGEYDQAIADYNKAIELKPDDAVAYSNLGVTYYQLGKYQEAINQLNKAVEKGSTWAWTAYWRDTALEKLKKQEEIARLNEPVDVDKLSEQINEHVEEIKKLVLSEEKLVVHYTALHTTKNILTTEKSKLRFYNAIYMNDPEEGEVLFSYFDDKEIKECFENGKRVNETSVYLGSFLPAPSHEDELVMWRTYGKDGDKMEAGGCSLVLDTKFFHKDGETKVKDKAASGSEPEQVLMKVVYLKNEKFHPQTPDGIEDKLQALKKALKELIELRKKADEKEHETFDRIIFKSLSVISYLFKSSDYAFESEVRVVQYMPLGSDLIKRSENNSPGEPPLKMYVESVREILPYLNKVYLGAKVPNPSHWSAYFDYEIRQQAKESTEKITVEIAKSICKFQ